MTVPTISWAHPDGAPPTLAVSGPLLSIDHGLQLSALSAGVDNLLIDLSNVTVINESGLELLRGIARQAAAGGRRLAFVCTELIMRSELLLADLDGLAPVFDREELAAHLLRTAAA